MDRTARLGEQGGEVTPPLASRTWVLPPGVITVQNSPSRRSEHAVVPMPGSTASTGGVGAAVPAVGEVVEPLDQPAAGRGRTPFVAPRRQAPSRGGVFILATGEQQLPNSSASRRATPGVPESGAEERAASKCSAAQSGAVAEGGEHAEIVIDRTPSTPAPGADDDDTTGVRAQQVVDLLGVRRVVELPPTQASGG